MATTTHADERYTDEYGIERDRDDEPGAVDKVRDKSEFVDHLMRMQDRYTSMGGNQYSAGITYFSVLAIFPILMLVVAAAAAVLANRPELLTQLQEQIAESVSGEMGTLINDILATAIEQRGAVAGIGALTTLWSGLGWMNNLRYGVSKMWKVDPTAVGNFVKNKAADLLGLIGLIIAFIIAFSVTAIGNSGLTTSLLDLIGLGDVPGIRFITAIIAILVGVLANFLVMAWMVFYLPRTKVPRRPGLQAAFIGAMAFEVIKQLGSLFFSNALSNPAGATFGPIIGLMVVFYLVWRVVMYISAWAATDEESLRMAQAPSPEPAIIRVRQEINHAPDARTTGAAVGVGAALGAAGAGLIALLTRK
ncbi:YhjD/YihY/BrkB family envelope integrity protein [Corynebacterium suedekumii]|uniref:YhjD/YihY/BrkB family envelope integrity protein n=1 Tax=Corynebacterium suedekumii TaxID=3049801 RepID=A0ABY8VV90_9CORY|nr:YhjD/YihY/BrkB family envelope integrity protein [Corynebacterium suedekumii]WIM71435.1 YhjD/YihY/BrkB family envelope integrity protein [Corynebacterium suedekumii]